MALQTLSLSLISAVVIAWFYRPVRIVRVQGVLCSIRWTARSWLWNYPITPNFDRQWDEGDPSVLETWMKNRKRVLRSWHFLRPFFASRGYDPYVHEDPKAFCSRLIPCTKHADSSLEMSFPFALRCCRDDKEAEFEFISPLAWPARDKNGRDVVIKAISGAGASPTKELQAFRLLHSEALRDHPRNRTIPILEYIEFDQQIFAVMPRWSEVYLCDFVNVGELIRYGRAFFEAVAFLHEHRIAQGDILQQNMFMDVMVPSGLRPFLAGLAGPERRYAFIDFETATLPPADGSASSPELEKAFKHDVYRLATELEVNLRCIEDVIPDVGHLFDSMKDSDGPSQPTAAASLARFEEICSVLTEEDLERPVEATRWFSGEMEYRNGPPVYLASHLSRS